LITPRPAASHLRHADRKDGRAEIYGTASPSKHDAIAPRRGHAIDYRTRTLRKVNRLTDNEGVDVIMTRSGHLVQEGLSVLRPGAA